MADKMLFVSSFGVEICFIPFTVYGSVDVI